MNHLTYVIYLVFSVAQASSINSRVNHIIGDCVNVAITQNDMNLCTQHQAQESVQKLKTFLKNIEQHLDQDDLWNQIEKQQKEWEQVRDQYCFWEKSFFGIGTMSPTVYHNCMTFSNLWRIRIIRKLLCENYEIKSYCFDPEY